MFSCHYCANTRKNSAWLTFSPHCDCASAHNMKTNIILGMKLNGGETRACGISKLK